MGQTSSRSSIDNRQRTNDVSREEPIAADGGVFGFVSLLIGTVQLPLPVVSCTEALVDLVAEADALCDLRLVELPTLSNSRKIKFTPHVLTTRAKDLAQMPSMTTLERILFLHESVIVVADDRSSEVKILSLTQLNELSKLHGGLAELQALRNHGTMNGNQIEECGVCLDEEPDCILPCGHQLCRNCERLWVHRKLNCPFCRATTEGDDDWQVAKYDENTLNRDIEQLSSKVTTLWKKRILPNERLEQFLEPYEEISRQVDPFSEERDGYVFL